MQPERNASDVRTDDDHVELETTLQELVLDLRGDAVETDIAVGEDGLLRSGSHCGSCGPRGRVWRRAGVAGVEDREAMD